MTMTCERIAKFATPTGRILLDDDGNVIESDDYTDSDPGAELVERVNQYAAAHAMSWSEALKHVRQSSEGQQLIKSYGLQRTGRRGWHNGPEQNLQVNHPALSDRPDQEIDKLAKQHMEASGEKSYSAAVRHVLAASRALRQAYARYANHAR